MTSPGRLARGLRRILFVEYVVAAAVAATVEVGLRLTTVPRLAGLLGVVMATDSAVDGTGRRPLPRSTRDRFAAVDAVMSRWPFGDTCLRRSLVLGHRLRRWDPALRIGVRLDETGEVLAHAWLVVAGHSLDTSGSDYAPLLGRHE